MSIYICKFVIFYNIFFFLFINFISCDDFILLNEIGKISPTVSYLNIKFDINILNITKLYNKYENLLDSYINKNITLLETDDVGVDDAIKNTISIIGAYHTEKKNIIKNKLNNIELFINNRMKRDVVTGALGGTALILGMTNTYQININTQTINMLIDKVDQLTNLTLYQIERLENKINSFIINNPTIYESKLKQIENKLEYLLYVIDQILSSCQNNKLSINVFTSDELYNIYDISYETIKNASKNNELLITNVYQILLLDVMFYYNNDGNCYFILNVPYVNNKYLFTLYKYTPFPSRYDDQFYLINIPEYIYIGVQLEYNLTIELNNYDINQCKKISDLYICNHINILHKNHNTCLTSIFTNDLNNIFKYCSYNLMTNEDTVCKVNNNIFLLYFKENVTIETKNIYNNIYQKYSLIRNKPYKFIIQPNNTLILPNHIIITNNYINIDKKFILFENTNINNLNNINYNSLLNTSFKYDIELKKIIKINHIENSQNYLDSITKYIYYLFDSIIYKIILFIIYIYLCVILIKKCTVFLKKKANLLSNV